MQANFEASTFGAELCAMKVGVEMVEAIRYKLQMFGVPMYGYANVFCDNETVYNNTTTPESVLKKKHDSIAYHRCMEEVDDNTIRVSNQGTVNNLSNLFTKIITSERRRFLLDNLNY